ncbi:MAG: YkgJ family cysteine cluster protein [Acidobacteriota bacterium]|nr:YkgJ family cysteine cluster protein [Acidobacteriota bacterium]
MQTGDWVTGQVKLSIGGEPLEMQMTVPAKPVKPQRMLPIFQQMANSFTEMGETAVKNAGAKISCKKGCGACCRQPVPVAEIEAHQLAELVENMPEPRRSIVKQRFADAYRHFQSIGWFERLENCAEQKELERTVLRYFYEGVPCPFLENESCSIHEARPLACREYLVTTPAKNCSKPSAKKVRLIPLPVKAAATLRHVGQTKQRGKINFVPLVLALEWVERNPDDFLEKTGEQWMADFFRYLTKSEIPQENGGAKRAVL